MIGLLNLLLSFSQSIGYSGIVLLMAVESSFIPFPSEIVIPPAAYLASQGEMNIFLVILAGLIGSLIGAIINYYIAISLGRFLIYKIADHKICNFLFINSKKIKKAENYFLQYGNVSTFLGRFIPAVRQLISLPAGFARMNFKKFVFWTSLGSGIWVTILAFLGYMFGANQELLIKYYQEISWGFIILVIVLIIFAIFRKKFRSDINEFKR